MSTVPAPAVAATPPATPARLHGLDHLRALAIVLVLSFHYRIFPHPAWLTTAGKFGWTGVDLFFTLSGYLMAAQLFREATRWQRISLRRFLLKRAFRILPAYWFVVGLYFLVPGFREREALPALWRFLTFTQNFGLDLGQHGTFSHAWSLCVEEQFYLVLPLGVAVCLPIRRPARLAGVLLALLGLGLLARGASWCCLVAPAAPPEAGLAWYKWLYYPTYNRLDGLLAGISLAALFQFSPRLGARLARWGNWLVVGSLVVLAGAWLLCRDEHSFLASVLGFPVVALGYGLLVAAAISPHCFLYKLKSTLTTYLATLSYGIYLLHKGIIHLVQQQAASWHLAIDGNQMLLLCLACTLAGAFLLHVLLEKPFLRLRRQALARFQPVASAAAQTP